MGHTNEQMTKVQDELGKIQIQYDVGNYSFVVKECCSLFEMAFKKIFKEALATFNYQDRTRLMDIEREIGKGNKDVEGFTFGELVGLNERAKLLSKWSEYVNRDMGLINGIRFSAIVDLRNSLTHTNSKMDVTCSRYDADLVFNCLRNMLATLYMNLEPTKPPKDPKDGDKDTQKKDKSATEESTSDVPISEPPVPEPTTDEDETEMVNIALNRKRGLIINQSDGTRNISYKVETINRMLSVVYEKVTALASEEDANSVLYDMGYDSGSAFGCIINGRWELENNLSLNDKITMWCDFDSEVGWGRFVNNLKIDEEEGTISGTIDINENFLCYNRKKGDVKICVFLKGYCEGVLEELLGGQQVKLTCAGNICPLRNALKKKCSYEVTIVE